MMLNCRVGLGQILVPDQEFYSTNCLFRNVHKSFATFLAFNPCLFYLAFYVLCNRYVYKVTISNYSDEKYTLSFFDFFRHGNEDLPLL